MVKETHVLPKTNLIKYLTFHICYDKRSSFVNILILIYPEEIVRFYKISTWDTNNSRFYHILYDDRLPLVHKKYLFSSLLGK